MAIRTPPGWGVDALARSWHTVTDHRPRRMPAAPIVIRRIGFADLRWALARGIEDFGATRTDVLAICLVYPLLGLLLGRLAFDGNMLHLIFPITAGFAIVGPLAAVGLNEMSRRRERGESHGWVDAFAIFRSPAIGDIVLMGLILMAMYLFWLLVAAGIYDLTLGPKPPVSITRFAHDIFSTGPGLVMAVTGIALGFIIATAALVLSLVTFPMLLDRNVPLDIAVGTSIRVAGANPFAVALWGAIIAASLILGSIPLLLGLIFVMPVLGHATWHLYRRTIRP